MEPEPAGITGAAPTAFDEVRPERLTVRSTLLLVACFGCALLDGYDLQVVAYVIPELAKQWSIPLAEFGLAISAGLAGLVFGALVLSPLADRYGRRITMITAVGAAALASFANAFVSNVMELVVCRLTIGTALGVITALIVAIAFEAAPARLRVVAVTVVGCGLALGNLISGLLASVVIPAFGWDVLFFVASAFSLIIIILFAFFLVDTPGFFEGEKVKYLASIAALLKPGQAYTTILIWLLYFGCNCASYLLLSWLPSLLTRSGYTTADAALATSAISMGGIVGGLGSGMLLARFGRAWLLIGYFAAVILVALLPLFFGSSALFFANFVIGISILGGYVCNNVVTSEVYPLHLRASGLGWAQGVGRTGSIVSPLIVALALQLNTSNQTILLFTAAFPLLSAIAVLLLMRKERVAQSGKF